MPEPSKFRNQESQVLASPARQNEDAQRSLIEPLGLNESQLADVEHIRSLAELALPSIERLARLMAKGAHHDPETARATRRSLNKLLDTLETVCKYRLVNFAEVLAYLNPVEDLLVALALVAGERNCEETMPRTTSTRGRQE